MFVVYAHATDASIVPGAPKANRPAACAKGQVGGVVVSNKMAGDTLANKVKGDQAGFRLRQKDDAVAFAKVSKLKAGNLYCVQDDGS